MDETTFQEQLRELKQRVSNMADISGSWTDFYQPHTHPGLAPGVAPNHHQDLYTAQLRDVEHKLDHMQTNLPNHWQGFAAKTTTSLNPVTEMLKRQAIFQQDIQLLAGTIERNNLQAYGVSTGLQNSLISVARELRDRCAALENTVSALGSNNAFTPASSEATFEDLTAAQEGFSIETDTLLHEDGGSGTATHPDSRLAQPYQSEPSYDFKGSSKPSRHSHDPDNTLASRISAFNARQTAVGEENIETRSRPAADPEPFMAICPPKIDHNADSDTPANLFEPLSTSGDTSIPRQQIQKDDDTTEERGQLEDVRRAQSEPVQQQNQQSGIRQEAETPSLPWSQVPSDEAQLTIEQSTNQQLRELVAAKEEEIVELQFGQFADSKDMAEKDKIIAHLRECKTAAEEAFEITRSNLGKRLGEAEDRHYEYEIEARRWRACAESAQHNLEAVARSNRDLQEARIHERGRLRDEMKQCEASRHHFMTKYVDENYRLKWLQQAKLQSEQRLHQRLDECERALREAKLDRDDCIRVAIESRDEDLDKLHIFCEEKDIVVRRQEQIIAQGASILGERDAEIDRLSAALDESQRSEQDAREHAAKNKRIIEKRDAQLEDLHRDVKEERERRCRLEDLMRRDADAMRTQTQSGLGAARAGARVKFGGEDGAWFRAVSGGQPEHQKPVWAPQPIRPSDRLPHEENKASLWEDGQHATMKHKFGSSGPIVQRRHKSGRDSKSERAPRGDDDQRFPSSSNEVTEDGSTGQHRRHSAKYSDPPRHQSEPLKNNRKALQLLAGWTETFQGQQKDDRSHEQRASGSKHHTRQTHADMSHQRQAIGGGGGGARRSPSSRMEAQASTNSGPAENGRHALPLDMTWLPALDVPAVIERVGSVPDLRAGNSRSHASKECGAMSKPASMFDLRPQTRHMPSPQQTYRAPSVETEAESSSADERARERQ